MMPYILHVALILAGCLVFYKLLLQKETFFRLNRWILLCCLVISFGLPFVQVPQQWSFRQADTTVGSLPVTRHSDPPVSELIRERTCDSLSDLPRDIEQLISQLVEYVECRKDHRC